MGFTLCIAALSGWPPSRYMPAWTKPVIPKTTTKVIIKILEVQVMGYIFFEMLE